MPRKILNSQTITIPQVKAILERLGEEQLDQFQRRSLDYAAKFSKMDPQMAEELKDTLAKKFELDEEEAAQIVNCMPKSLEEMRIFLAGGRKIVETAKLQAILSTLADHRKEK